MKILMWAVMLVSLTDTILLSWLGLAYWYVGQGVHPALALGGILALLVAGWQAAKRAD